MVGLVAGLGSRAVTDGAVASNGSSNGSAPKVTTR